MRAARKPRGGGHRFTELFQVCERTIDFPRFHLGFLVGDDFSQDVEHRGDKNLSFIPEASG